MNKRSEYLTIRREAVEECGAFCVNCGSREKIQYHHIVPLEFGGNNVISNIVPLCEDCHYKAHGKHKNTGIEGVIGRPRKDAPVGYRDILTKYLTGTLPGKRAKKMLWLEEGARISDQWYYKEFLREMGIERIEKKTAKRVTVYYESGKKERYFNGEREG